MKTDCGRDDWQGLQSECKYSSSPQLCVHQEMGRIQCLQEAFRAMIRELEMIPDLEDWDGGGGEKDMYNYD